MAKSRVLYQAGQLARNAFFAGRGIADGQRLDEEDQAALNAYYESDAFKILIDRIERDHYREEI